MINFNKNTLEQFVNNYDESDKIELKKFFELDDVRKALIANNFEGIYELWIHFTNRARHRLTAVLLLADIDFLSHQHAVVRHQFAHLPITSVKLPNNIETIGDYAFFECVKLEELHIPKSVQRIMETIVGNTYAKIRYEGTYEEWLKIAKDTGWANNIDIKKIYCSDGEYEW